MLKAVLLLSGLVALVSADCGILDRLVVKEQWAKAYGEGTNRATFGEHLWKRMFELVPESRGIFDRVNGADIYSAAFRAHSLRVLGGLDMCVGLMDDPAALDAQLTHLNGQHVKRKIPASYFKAFKAAILDTVPDILGSCFNFHAWSTCLDALNSKLINAEELLPAAAP